ncbi:RICIN domain-containing protein [Streptomyces sp. NPDC052721]|uniref:RICIN domain-containing protein n=1 Tax=Streptomyces sp. NPDC052721 TaxID=3154955 RepID=UPI003426F17C
MYDVPPALTHTPEQHGELRFLHPNPLPRLRAARRRPVRESWSFTPTGDGVFTLVNAATGRLLGVDSARAAGRAWGAGPTVTAARAAGPTAGQQWFVIPGSAEGTYRLVNRYSGLVLGLSATAGRLAETTPPRTWTDVTGGTVGGGRTAAEQTLPFTPAGGSHRRAPVRQSKDLVSEGLWPGWFTT